MAKSEYELYKKRLYHSYKNEEALPKFIIGTVLCCMFSGFILLIPWLWIIYGLLCWKNNQELNQSMEIQIKRRLLEEYERKKAEEEEDNNNE